MKMMTARRACASAMAIAMAFTAVSPAFAAGKRAPAPKPPPPAAAQPAVPAGPTAAQFAGRRVVHALLADMEGYRPLYEIGMIALRGEIRKDAEKKGGFALMAFERLGPWSDMAADAAWDEFLADRPKFEILIGDYLGNHFTAPELNALADLLTPEFMREVRAMALTLLAEQPKNFGDMKFSAEMQGKLDAFTASPEGKSLSKKAKTLFDAKGADKEVQALGLELIAAYVPGVLRRFGEKAEAAEVARRPQGWQ